MVPSSIACKVKMIGKYYKRGKQYVRKHSLKVLIVLAIVSIPFIYMAVKNSTLNEVSMNKNFNHASLANGAKIIRIEDTTPTMMLQRNLAGMKVSVRSVPDNALSDGAMEGFCFIGRKGSLLVELNSELLVSGVAIQHIEGADPNILKKSAPRTISVAGAKELDGEYHNIVSGKYNIKGDATQFFKSNVRMPRPVKFLRVKIESNHGAEHTCVYGIRAFGSPYLNKLY